MNKEYKIGDLVYWAKYDMRKVKKVCSVCFGKLEVIVILGNSEQIKTPCNYCDIGYSGPRGYREVYELSSDIQAIIIGSKEVNEDSRGKSITYKYSHWLLKNDDIFQTEKEAEKRVKEKIKIQQAEEAKRYEYQKNSKIMKLSWSVGYHQRQIRDAEKDIKYHSSKVEIVKKLIKIK